jgi:hypothetical protein
MGWRIGPHRRRLNGFLGIGRREGLSIPRALVASCPPAFRLSESTRHVMFGVSTPHVPSCGVIVCRLIRVAPLTNRGQIIIVIRAASFEGQHMVNVPILARSDLAGAFVAPLIMCRENASSPLWGHRSALGVFKRACHLVGPGMHTVFATAAQP